MESDSLGMQKKIGKFCLIFKVLQRQAKCGLYGLAGPFFVRPYGNQ
jgi:hypothetical protein